MSNPTDFATPTGGQAMIFALREKQIQDGFGPDQEDALPAGSLLGMATILETSAGGDPQLLMMALEQWPADWGMGWYHADNSAMSKFTQAGTLYQAEAERLDRAGISNEMAKEGMRRCAACIDAIIEDERPRIIT